LPDFALPAEPELVLRELVLADLAAARGFAAEAFAPPDFERPDFEADDLAPDDFAPDDLAPDDFVERAEVLEAAADFGPPDFEPVARPVDFEPVALPVPLEPVDFEPVALEPVDFEPVDLEAAGLAPDFVPPVERPLALELLAGFEAVADDFAAVGDLEADFAAGADLEPVPEDPPDFAAVAFAPLVLEPPVERDAVDSPVAPDFVPPVERPPVPALFAEDWVAEVDPPCPTPELVPVEAPMPEALAPIPEVLAPVPDEPPMPPEPMPEERDSPPENEDPVVIAEMGATSAILSLSRRAVSVTLCAAPVIRFLTRVVVLGVVLLAIETAFPIGPNKLGRKE
jgi:hypothetical protein